MTCAATDPELRDWFLWTSENGNTPSFVRKVAQAALIASLPDYELLRPVLIKLKRRYPEDRRSGHGDDATK